MIVVLSNPQITNFNVSIGIADHCGDDVSFKKPQLHKRVKAASMTQDDARQRWNLAAKAVNLDSGLVIPFSHEMLEKCAAIGPVLRPHCKDQLDASSF
jgi:hypothetical protein